MDIRSRERNMIQAIRDWWHRQWCYDCRALGDAVVSAFAMPLPVDKARPLTRDEQAAWVVTRLLVDSMDWACPRARAAARTIAANIRSREVLGGRE